MMTKDIFCSLPAHQIKITGQKKPQNSFRKTLQYKKTIALRNSKCNIKFKIPQYQIQQNSSEYTAKPTKVSQYNWVLTTTSSLRDYSSIKFVLQISCIDVGEASFKSKYAAGNTRKDAAEKSC